MAYCYNAASIVATLAAGSAASPYFVMASITKRLCRPACAEKVPVFAPAFGVLGFTQVGEGQYMATVQVQGVITYDPCGTQCCAVSEPVNQTFAVPFASATAPTAVSVSAGTSVNSIATPACQSCGREFVSNTPLTITVTTAAA